MSLSPTPDRRGCGLRAQALQGLAGCPVAGGDRAVEVADPSRGCLCAGPEDPSVRLPDGRAVRRPRAWRQVAVVGTAGQLLARPDHLGVRGRLVDTAAEKDAEVVLHHLDAVFPAEGAPPDELIPLDEAGEDSRGAGVQQAAVRGGPDGPACADGRPAEPLAAPPRLVVDQGDL